MGFHSLVNTSIFSQTARDFKKNGDRYITAPKGSRDYYQFWEEEDRRCLYGYKVGDLWIPGRMYFWLNHFPIMRVPEEELLRAMQRKAITGKLEVTEATKIQSFPKFWEVHYEWWNFKHIAWYGGEFMGIKSPGNRHLGALKTRGAGWSYLEACDAVYNYNFIPGSKSYFFAGAEPFLIGDAIMDKVKDGLDWINTHAPYWKQNRQVHKNLMHQKASFLDEKGDEKGSMSEIIAQIVDKPGKTRGKRGRKASFEEAGTFPVLEPALEVAMGSMREGSIYVGQISVFGTGGEQGPSLQGLENIFNNPRAWDMLVFPNIWDEGLQHTECGYFVPCWRANSWYMDEEGNVDVPGAIAADEEEREKKKLTGKPKDLDRRKAEYPRNPREALQRLSGNGFNIAEIDGQIKRLESDKILQGMIRHGDVIVSSTSPEGIEFVPRPKNVARPIEDFPHSQAEGNDLTGCVSIVQRPYRDQKGRVPAGMYLLTFDPYQKEQSEDQTSLWSWKIWKLDNNIDPSFANLPVAWGCGRPTKYMDNHDRMFKAARMYNARIQGEVAGGGQSVIDYARTHRILHLLCHEPMSASTKENEGKSKENVFLMNMPTERKNLGLTYLEDWHVAVRGMSDKGVPILNVHMVYDIAWLREMRKHDPEKGNYDRISDALPAMYMLKENYAQQIRHRRKTRSFYNRELYGGDGSGDTGGVTSAY
jgi:hypothetical protein